MTLTAAAATQSSEDMMSVHLSNHAFQTRYDVMQ